jgi:hypothetical protein
MTHQRRVCAVLLLSTACNLNVKSYPLDNAIGHSPFAIRH